MKNRNIVMGVAVGYGWREVKNFVVTLRNTGYDGDIRLFMDNVPDEEQVHFKLHKVNIQKIHRYLRFLPNFIAKKRFTRYINPVHKVLTFLIKHLPIGNDYRVYFVGRYTSIFLSPACSRYFYYYNFLKRHPYENVFISDVKDVVFQTDPFVGINSRLQLAFENIDLTVGAEPVNKRWVSILYGENVLDKIGKGQISCSGTTLGGFSTIVDYLAKMIYETANHTGKIAGHFGFDQGIHNYLVQTGKLEGADFNFNNQGMFLTMLSEVDERLLFNNGYLYNQSGGLVPILHQYNWKPKIKLKVLEEVNGEKN